MATVITHFAEAMRRLFAIFQPSWALAIGFQNLLQLREQQYGQVTRRALCVCVQKENNIQQGGG